MRHMKRLSECELDVMQVIWDLGPEMNQPEIKDELEIRKSRTYGRTTIATWVTRLKENGFVNCRPHGKVTYYYPLIEREEYMKLELEHFARRFFSGSYNQAILSFARAEDLPEEEQEKLEALVEGWKQNEIGR